VLDAVKRVGGLAGKGGDLRDGAVLDEEHFEREIGLAVHGLFQDQKTPVEDELLVFPHELLVQPRHRAVARIEFRRDRLPVFPAQIAGEVRRHLKEETPEAAAVAVVNEGLQAAVADGGDLLHQVFAVLFRQVEFFSDGEDHGPVFPVKLAPSLVLAVLQPPQVGRAGGEPGMFDFRHAIAPLCVCRI